MTLIPNLDRLPHVDLRGFVSPTHLLPRLSEELGVEVWCKRDDIGSVGLAGNKVRKLEMVLAHAQSVGADHVVMEGSRLSNATRALAAGAASLGMKCTLVLCHDEPRQPVGNLLLDVLFNAHLRLVGDLSWQDLATRTDDIAQELRDAGEKVYRLPIGCATARGAVGFARAFAEATDQMRAQGAEAATLIHASSGGSTHAGLVLGRALTASTTRVIGVIVAGQVYPDVPGTYVRLATEAAELLDAQVTVSAADLELTEAYIGDGYGIATPAAIEAVDLMARLEGIVVDPVYSAKALAALIDLSRKRELRGPVMFWHTGGYHALFDPTYTHDLWTRSPRLRSVIL